MSEPASKKEQPMSPPENKGITRREAIKQIVAGATGLGVGAVGGTLLERETTKNVIKTPAIVGFVFQDVEERRGIYQGWHTERHPGEPPAEGVPVSLVKVERPGGPGETITKTVTDKNGVYIFEGVGPGRYRATPDVGSAGQWNTEVDVSPEARIVFVGIFGVKSA